MTKEDELKYKRLFQIGAMWNILIAGSGLLLFTLTCKLIFGFDIVIPPGPASFGLQLCFSIIFVYGIGYYFVSTDISQNRGIVWMGILGKIAVFLLILIYFFNSHVTFMCMLLGVGDLIFAVLFFLFILKQDAVDG